MSPAYSKATLFDRILPYALSLFNTFSDLLEILAFSHLEQKKLRLLGDAHTSMAESPIRLGLTLQSSYLLNPE
jgi:hypothetical protein